MILGVGLKVSLGTVEASRVTNRLRAKDIDMREFTKGKTYASAYVKAAAVASSVTVIVMITGAGRKFG